MSLVEGPDCDRTCRNMCLIGGAGVVTMTC